MTQKKLDCFLNWQGKYLEIQFNQNGQLNGGKIYKFLLEKVSYPLITSSVYHYVCVALKSYQTYFFLCCNYFYINFQYRLTHLTQGERNFHVFYQLLSGCTSKEKGN